MRTAALILLYVAAPVLGTYLMFRPTFDSHFERVQTERGDGLLNHYILENSWLAISDPDYCGSLLSPPMYFPAKRTIYYSENLFGVAPVYWALRVVLPYDLAYAWWQILLNLLNFAVFAVVARRLRWPHLIALGGAFMWGFAMVHADQIKHQQMIGRFWMPLALYYAISLVAAPSAKALNRLLACVFLQSLAGIYTGWFLVAGLGVFVPALAAAHPGAAGGLKAFARANRWKVFRIVALWGLALGALFVPYLVVNWGIGRTYEETYGLMPTPSAWLTGPPDSMWIITTASMRSPVSMECWLFSGFVVYLLMFAATVSLLFDKPKTGDGRQSAGVTPEAGGANQEPGSSLTPDSCPLSPEKLGRAVIVASMLTVLVWALLTLTLHDKGDSLWRWVRFLPGGMAIRCVSRVYLLVYLFGAVAGLTWLVRVTERIGREWLRYAVQALVVGAMMFEQTRYEQPSFERKNFYPLVDKAAEQLKGAEAGWVVPRYSDPTGDVATGPYGEVFGMWVGLRANVPVLNGYSGRAPTDFPPMGGLSEKQIRTWLKGKFRGKVRVIDTELPPSLPPYPPVVVE
jgi:hypothetical protein